MAPGLVARYSVVEGLQSTIAYIKLELLEGQQREA